MPTLQVHKFGGASIQNANSIQNVAQIIKNFQGDKPLLIVISALGKTTNALEKITNSYFQQNNESKMLLAELETSHLEIIKELFEDVPEKLMDIIQDFITDLEWFLDEPLNGSYDYAYDQIVSYGELLSSTIVSYYLNHLGLGNLWIDVRDFLSTDNQYRDANILWEESQAKAETMQALLHKNKILVTQGFIGSSSENFSTTLGREGSDYSAAIFSHLLGAESMTIWKDVPGVLNGDPRIFPNRILLDKIDYEEAIEMTYYGAQVIHPKTLNPLKSKNIPLYVKSFLAAQNSGTEISTFSQLQYPPVLVVKDKQCLIQINARNFEFVNEAKFAELFQKIANHRIKVNMTQNTALAFTIVVNNDPIKIQEFINEIQNEYLVAIENNLKLLTIRHAPNVYLEKLLKDRNIYLEERIKQNVQILLDENEPFLDTDM